MKQIFQTKKLKTCLKLIINELARFPIRSDNVYFMSNEQVSIAVCTAMFCVPHVEHPLIKLKLHHN